MPTSVLGAKRIISSRLRELTLAKTESKREKLREEINACVEHLYKYAKAGERAAKELGCYE